METIDLDPLIRALEKEHVDLCRTDTGSNNTCDVLAAYKAGCYFWAAHLLMGATECPETCAAYEALKIDDDDLEGERIELLSRPHMDCQECGAIVWTEEPRDTCGNCRAAVECKLDMDALDEFTRAYVECALWSSTDNSRDDGGDPLDKNYGPEDVAPECARQMIDDCQNFQHAQHELLERAYTQFPTGRAGVAYGAANAGHDFWLTRNGHGAGFWDRGLGRLGDKLSKECKPYGSVDLYVGDDGKIYSN